MLTNYSNRFIILLILLALLLMVGYTITFASKTPQKSSQVPLWLFLEPIAPHYVPHIEVYGSVVEDLIDCESGGNPEALGDNGRAKSILQFHEPTFRRYCVEKYGYTDNIWDTDVQINCAAEMLNNGLGYHWTCYNKVMK